MLLRAGRWVLCQADLWLETGEKENEVQVPGWSLWCRLTGRMLRGQAGLQKEATEASCVWVGLPYFGGTFHMACIFSSS